MVVMKTPIEFVVVRWWDIVQSNIDHYMESLLSRYPELQMQVSLEKCRIMELEVL